MCAKCTLKKADAAKCQNVLVVADKDGKETHYYIAKNDVSDKLGEVCTGKTPVSITGTVAEKDGKKWITATKIEEAKG
jgi:hypothetical protein